MQIMCTDIPIGGFNWVKNASKINEEYINNYDENGNIGFFLKVDIEYPQELHDLHSDLPFLPEKMEINGHSKLACMLYDKKEYVKQALNHGLQLKKSDCFLSRSMA